MVHINFAKSETGSGESVNGTDYPVFGDNTMWEIDSNMNDYEWSTLTIEIPTSYVDSYLAKIRLGFSGNELAIRAISIEN